MRGLLQARTTATRKNEDNERRSDCVSESALCRRTPLPPSPSHCLFSYGLFLFVVLLSPPSPHTHTCIVSSCSDVLPLCEVNDEKEGNRISQTHTHRERERDENQKKRQEGTRVGARYITLIKHMLKENSVVFSLLFFHSKQYPTKKYTKESILQKKPAQMGESK